MKPAFLLDGSNCAHLEQHSRPSLEHIERVHDALKREFPAADIQIIVDASLRHRVATGGTSFETWSKQKGAHQAPSRQEADLYILKFARRFGWVVVSCDDFRDRRHLRVGITILKPMLLCGHVELGEPIRYVSEDSDEWLPAEMSKTTAEHSSPQRATAEPSKSTSGPTTSLTTKVVAANSSFAQVLRPRVVPAAGDDQHLIEISTPPIVLTIHEPPPHAAYCVGCLAIDSVSELKPYWFGYAHGRCVEQWVIEFNSDQY